MLSNVRKIVSKRNLLLKLYSSKNVATKILQQTTTKVNPFAGVKINCSFPVIVTPFDLLDCPNSDQLRATVSSNCEKSSGQVSIQHNSESIEIVEENLVGDSERLTCLLEVPIKSDLDIVSKSDVHISAMYSDHIKVSTSGTINTGNLRCTSVYLDSTEGGNINCKGLILAHKIDVHTVKNGEVFLDKLQGDLLHCKTEKGNITTNSCYVETSKFVTEDGKLNLKNIHKKSEVYVLKDGNIDMTGIHGNVYVKTNGSETGLQFSEIYGDNIIIANNSKNLTINISDLIEETCFVEIHSDQIVLDDSISHLGDRLDTASSYFRMGSEDQKNKLLICSKGILRLGKMSWAESLKISMGLKETL